MSFAFGAAGHKPVLEFSSPPPSASSHASAAKPAPFKSQSMAPKDLAKLVKKVARLVRCGKLDEASHLGLATMNALVLVLGESMHDFMGDFPPTPPKAPSRQDLAYTYPASPSSTSSVSALSSPSTSPVAGAASGGPGRVLQVLKMVRSVTDQLQTIVAMQASIRAGNDEEDRTILDRLRGGSVIGNIVEFHQQGRDAVVSGFEGVAQFVRGLLSTDTIPPPPSPPSPPSPSEVWVDFVTANWQWDKDTPPGVRESFSKCLPEKPAIRDVMAKIKEMRSLRYHPLSQVLHQFRNHVSEVVEVTKNEQHAKSAPPAMSHLSRLQRDAVPKEVVEGLKTDLDQFVKALETHLFKLVRLCLEPDDWGRLRKEVADYCLEEGEDAMLAAWHSRYASRDRELAEAIERLRPHAHCTARGGVTHLRRLHKEKRAKGKLDCIIASLEAIYADLKKNPSQAAPSSEPVGADIMFPRFLRCVVAANPLQAWSTSEYLAAFGGDCLLGQAGYAQATLHAALVFLLSPASKSLFSPKDKEKADVGSRDSSTSDDGGIQQGDKPRAATHPPSDAPRKDVSFLRTVPWGPRQ